MTTWKSTKAAKTLAPIKAEQEAIALPVSAEGAVEATAAVDCYHGKRLAVATELSDRTRSDVTRPMVTGGWDDSNGGPDSGPARIGPRQNCWSREKLLCRDDSVAKDGLVDARAT